MEWLIVVLVVVVLVATWVTWTAMRIDRLAARCESAWLSLDAALTRRSKALAAVVDRDPLISSTPAADGIHALAASAGQAPRPQRAAVENAISAAITDLTAPPPGPAQTPASSGLSAELTEACVRVQVARTFYNDAVRAAHNLRAQRLPRVLRLGRSRPVPDYFDIDDGAGIVAAVHP
ncbi:hypothetical protein EK0264_01350 [Epidermidibacterium keratini]|uniref:LemA family protein n=1 Tax=Epidermidibacterium keratini TaxID=1891644 RepID=A0A7L4YKK7_9ACTN|nr:hypothetical protein [Epidermidibacterium keratini]QHB99076.1 hypothetical protein EK0264_01350 [Epidermidibacterium keratini]